MFWYVFGIILTAGAEELMKAFIVLLFFETIFKIPSLFLFAIAESMYFFNAVYEHNIELGLNSEMAILATIFLLTGSKSFHIMTSIIYLKVKFKWWSIFFMTLIHSTINFYVDNLPALNVILYNNGAWFISAISGIFIYLYFLVDRQMSKNYKTTAD